ncbi:MAG: DUF547 domain-containing protein [Bacteroidota bacterium]|nr:DUF547 domain-containing protein [Bacteroidota bacterium]
MKSILFSLLLLGASLAVAARPFSAGSAPEYPDAVRLHDGWNELLHAHVSPGGEVDYRAIVAHPQALDDYLLRIKKMAPDAMEQWTENDKKAFWINLYNAATVRIIASYYPISSMQDIRIRSFLGSPKSPWEKSLVSVGGQSYSLNEIEHLILRKRYADPRIHFGLVCAAISCPVLRDEAYLGPRLSQQLDEQAAKFINDPGKNVLAGDMAMLSNVFEWYAADFGLDEQAVLDYVNRYANVRVQRGARVSYLPYNWGLNELGNSPALGTPGANTAIK